MISVCVSVNDAVFNYIISFNKVMNSFLINVILLKFFLIYTLKNILLNNNKLFKLLIKEDILYLFIFHSRTRFLSCFQLISCHPFMIFNDFTIIFGFVINHVNSRLFHVIYIGCSTFHTRHMTCF